VKKKPVLTEKVYVRLTVDEHAMLTEIAKYFYPHARGAQSLAVRSLITKTGSSRRKVALTKAAIEALRTHRRRQHEERLAAGEYWQNLNLVFCNQTGGYLFGNKCLTRYTSRSYDALACPISAFMTCATLLRP
jgi:hypothetical protein